jgi:hypothetical protein
MYYRVGKSPFHYFSYKTICSFWKKNTMLDLLNILLQNLNTHTLINTQTPFELQKVTYSVEIFIQKLYQLLNTYLWMITKNVYPCKSIWDTRCLEKQNFTFTLLLLVSLFVLSIIYSKVPKYVSVAIIALIYYLI